MTDYISQKQLTKDDVVAGWQSGENYDYYISNGINIPLSADWAIRNFKHWHNSYHVEAPKWEQTAWEPKMKDLVFSRYGFMCADSTTYKPYECNGKESNAFSQAIALSATEDFFNDISSQCDDDGGALVSTRYLNKWDARPDQNELLEIVAKYQIIE